MFVALNLLGSDGEARAGFERAFPVRELAEADLGALQVEQNAHFAAHALRGGPYGLDSLLVLFPGAVGRIHPEDLRAAVDERLDNFRGFAGRTKRHYNFRVCHV